MNNNTMKRRLSTNRQPWEIPRGLPDRSADPAEIASMPIRITPYASQKVTSRTTHPTTIASTARPEVNAHCFLCHVFSQLVIVLWAIRQPPTVNSAVPEHWAADLN